MTKVTTWIGARCEYCSAEWTAESKGKPLTFDYADDAISCTRGYGCARRRPEHERRGGDVRGLPVRQFLHEGHWYTVEELAALVEVDRPVMDERLRAGWHVAEALAPSRVKGRPPHYDGRLRAALARAGGRPYKPPPREVDAPQGRPAPIRGISAAGRAHGLKHNTLSNRCKKLGSLEAAIALGRPGATRGALVGVVAAARELGVARQTLAKRAAKLGSLEAAVESFRGRSARAA